ncbi:MAG TPA: prepilin-type N-terminal cleavage/methylation domain-containing protein [Gemmatimonadaceae bacterium]|nr:prepilin-type N-terminal cleavage/methylation domain-containing protein [Gemmatimonadaceae bacterium]
MSRPRHGFTLIELLIVVVIIGILATVAVPRYADAKERAAITGVISDLRSLIAAQEAHLAGYQTYAGAIGASEDAGTVAFTPTPSTTITVGAATAAGWNATATSTLITGSVTCGVYVGAAAPPGGMPAGTAESSVTCW